MTTSAELVFLVCSERSGSNFITRLLGGHSKICGPSPSHAFRLFVQNRQRYGSLEDAREWRALTADVSDAFSNMLGVWHTSVTTEQLLAVTPRSLGALLVAPYEAEATAVGASKILIKENHCYRLAPFILQNFPQARFLFMSRDPRDMAASWLKTNAVPGGVEKAVAVWEQDQTQAFHLFNQLIGSNRARWLRYEDILEDSVGTMTETLEWLGLDYEASMEAFSEDPVVKKNAERIAGWSNLGAGIMRGNTGSYRESLLDEEVRYIELVCHDNMESLGYRLDFDIPEDAKTRETMAHKLRQQLRTGSEPIEASEAKIRRRRNAVIQRIVSRRPHTVTEIQS